MGKRRRCRSRPVTRAPTGRVVAGVFLPENSIARVRLVGNGGPYAPPRTSQEHPMNIPRASRASAAIAVFATVPFTATVADSDPATVSAAAQFANRAGMRDWLADGERGLWIQTGSLKWFYARFTGRCPGLDSTNSLSFNTRASGNLYRTTWSCLDADVASCKALRRVRGRPGTVMPRLCCSLRHSERCQRAAPPRPPSPASLRLKWVAAGNLG